MIPAQSAALADHRHRITEDWIEDGAVTATKLATDLFGATPNVIEPDDAAAEGTAESFARSDHEHGIVAAAASDLTRTATSTEGSSTSFARADHVHATDDIGWGRLPNGTFTSTGADSARAAGVNTDMTVTVSWLSTRRYRVYLHSQVDYGTTSASYALELEHNPTVGSTVLIGRFDRWTPNETGAADSDLFCNGWVEFTPSADDAAAVLTVQNAAGSGGTISLTPGVGSRTLTVDDIGPA